MNQPSKLLGFMFRIGQYHFRVWKYGFEYGNKMGGKAFFFPWSNSGDQADYDIISFHERQSENEYKSTLRDE